MEVHEGPNEDHSSETTSQSDATKNDIKGGPVEEVLTLVYITTPIISMIF